MVDFLRILHHRVEVGLFCVGLGLAAMMGMIGFGLVVGSVFMRRK